MKLARSHFTMRRLMMATLVAALALAVIWWGVTDVMQLREYTYSGNTFVSSRRLTSQDFERLKYSKPWYFIEPDPVPVPAPDRSR